MENSAKDENLRALEWHRTINRGVDEDMGVEQTVKVCKSFQKHKSGGSVVAQNLLEVITINFGFGRKCELGTLKLCKKLQKKPIWRFWSGAEVMRINRGVGGQIGGGMKQIKVYFKK